MVIIYQAILIIIMLLGIVAVIGEREDKQLRDRMFVITIVAIISFLVSTRWFG